jgi:hypothetical protein
MSSVLYIVLVCTNITNMSECMYVCMDGCLHLHFLFLVCLAWHLQHLQLGMDGWIRIRE